MISEKQREKIREEAREILENFARVLETAGEVKKKGLKRQVGGFREEGDGERCDADPKNRKFSGSETSRKQEVLDFRKRMFENAPSAKGDCLIAEKKKWQ